MHRFLKWLGNLLFAGGAVPDPEPRPPVTRRRPTPRPVTVRPKPRLAPSRSDTIEFTPDFGGRIEDGGPGKNVLIRNRYLREDTGTHETLKIFDESLLESEDEQGIDPYNTGRFDRSKFWDVRPKK